MLKREKYKLSKNLTALKLRKNGFRNGAYRCNVYKDMFYFLMVIDVDNHDISYVDEIGEIIDLIKSSNEEKPNVIGYIPTKNGWHIITRPFNLKQFEPYTLEYQIDIQKNNPTILYLYND